MQKYLYISRILHFTVQCNQNLFYFITIAYLSNVKLLRLVIQLFRFDCGQMKGGSKFHKKKSVYQKLYSDFIKKS